MSFYLDDVSVVPYDGTLPDGLIEDMAFAQMVASFDIKTAKGVRVDLSKVKANKGDGKFENGVYTLTAGEEQSDPQFAVAGLNLDAGKYGVVVVKTKRENVTRQSGFQIFFTTDENKSIDEKKSINLPFESFTETDDGYFIGFYNFSTHSEWKGNITSLRFDPANASGVYTFTDVIILEN